MKRISWKEIILGTIAALSLLTSPAVGQMSSSVEEPAVRMDNRGSGSLNSGPGSMDSDRQQDGSRGLGHRSGDRLFAQASDVRQEDRREDRREDRQLGRREDRREDRQLDRREDRREDRQMDRRAENRSNAGGELRGLDRADRVAGEHGREGRDNAREVQMDRPHRPERMERPERAGRH